MQNTSMTESSPMASRYVDAQQAAAYLGMSVAWLRAAVFRRRIPYVKLGRAVRFSLRDLDEYARQRRVEPNSQSPAGEESPKQPDGSQRCLGVYLEQR